MLGGSESGRVPHNREETRIAMKRPNLEAVLHVLAKNRIRSNVIGDRTQRLDGVAEHQEHGGFIQPERLCQPLRIPLDVTPNLLQTVSRAFALACLSEYRGV